MSNDYVKQFYSIENRKKMAAELGFDEQEILDMPKRELHTLWCGVTRGKEIAAAEIKAEFFCIPIDIWEHRKTEFEKILGEVVEEMKEETEVTNTLESAT